MGNGRGFFFLVPMKNRNASINEFELSSFIYFV